MADDLLWDRRAKITIFGSSPTPGDYIDTDGKAGIEINGGDDASAPGLRVQFKVTKTSEKEPNTAEVAVTNLSPTRRASLKNKGMQVVVEAGYASTGIARIFLGDVRTVDHLRDGADWLTKIKLGDGERAYQNAVAFESFAGGTSAGDVLTFLANKMGIGLGNVRDQLTALSSVTFDQGYIVAGKAQREIQKLLKALGLLTWSIQDGELQMLPPDGALSLPIPLISPDTGLIGSPEMGTPEKKGKPQLCKFTSLLTPTKPGRKVRLRSERYDDVEVLVKRCTFEGDTRGGGWYTRWEGQILK